MNLLNVSAAWIRPPSAIRVGLEFCFTVLCADFVSGLLHWFEDAYGREDLPISGRWITRKNILHHRDPRSFTRNNWWQSSWDLACLSLLIVIAAAIAGHLTWHVWVFAIVGANANQIHKWAHRTPRENGRFITALQRWHLLQSPRHHARHHTNPKDSHYCILTDSLNPILDGIGFWEGCERVLLFLFGLRRRVDPSVAMAAGERSDRLRPSDRATRDTRHDTRSLQIAHRE